jgi:hypothetical protein
VRPAPPPLPFTLHELLLLDAVGNEAVDLHAMTFDDEGIGVVRRPGDRSRVLPWDAVLAQAVEPWAGGVIPEWWVDPEFNRVPGGGSGPGTVTDPAATTRPLPSAAKGALVVVQTSTGTYRFLIPGSDPRDLSRRITAFAVRHQGPAAASSVTTVVAWGLDAERRRTARPPKKPEGWLRVRPYLVVILILIIVAAVTVILLQSAGAIHLPLLGGSTGGVVSALSGLSGLSSR